MSQLRREKKCVATAVWYVEARDAANHPKMSRTAHHNKELFIPNINKPGLRNFSLNAY